jgi:alpha-galactosidase
LLIRALVATTGAFGLELDLAGCSREDLAELRAHIARYRQWRRLLATGDFHRLRDPAGGEAAWMVVSPDAREALVFHAGGLSVGNAPRLRLRLRGLRAEWRYRDRASGAVWGGDALMAHGFAWADAGDFAARWWHLVRTIARA